MSTIYSIITLAFALTAPLLIIALGGLYSERSGVVNIGLEGLMGIGAFSTALYISYNPSQIWIGILIGALAAALFSLLHAFASVTMRADQVISGTAINILSAALTVYLARKITGSANIRITKGLFTIKIPMLSKIPIIGKIFFNNNYLSTYVVLLIIILSWYLLYKTPFGLRLRACGENPQAADSMGVSVIKMRYIGVFISGLLAGIGGALVIVTTSNEFSPGTYNGLGFLALAALVFGKWKPFGVLWASLFFGVARTIANLSILYSQMQKMPNIIFNTFPYVITIVALVIFSKNSAGPKAAGEPYDPGKR